MTQTAHRPVVLSGPSGSGKSTLLKRLMKEFDGCFAFSVSHYHFVTREEMEKEIERNAFIEHAQFSYNMYGTSKKAVQEVSKTGKICVLDVDLQGVKSIKATDLMPRYVFIKPPNLIVLEKRLRGRGTETEDSLQSRLATALEALDYAEQQGAYDLIVVNDDADVAYEQLKGFLSSDLEQIIKSRFSK